MINASEQLCSKCSKANATSICIGCKQIFCPEDSISHRQDLSNEFDAVINKHDLLHQQFEKQDNDATTHPIMDKVNQWEKETIAKIKQEAHKAHYELQQLFTRCNEELGQKLRRITKELCTAKDKQDYLETHLCKWLDALEALQNELTTPSDFKVHIKAMSINVTLMPIEKFDRVYGDIRLEQNELAVVHGAMNSHAEVRGACLYLHGIHHIKIKIEKMLKDHWMFFGIISSTAEMDEKSYLTQSAYGWA
ncbi:unnamed protein product [Didymodactylos carnosus]|uniref:B box-type domain-containing protein n=1 Tax=Didymodactylos carnosus TaxID=1234261 RepID=A0A8S2H6L9_9BILA|nr:unnamed protein product [Didymodactylos carnosus]CAF3608090.1 unnamed protein product [Didymodactylos carnosus]